MSVNLLATTAEDDMASTTSASACTMARPVLCHIQTFNLVFVFDIVSTVETVEKVPKSLRLTTRVPELST